MKRAFFTLSCYVALCCYLPLFYGCGLFRKSTTTHLKSVTEIKEEKVKTAQLNTRDQSLGWSLSAIDDSLNSSSTVLIWPKGEFNLSATGGFSGQADRIEIRGRLKSGRKQVAEGIQLKEHAEQLSLKEAETKEVLKEEQERIKERFPVSGWWALLLVIPLFPALKWLFKQRTNTLSSSKIH